MSGITPENPDAVLKAAVNNPISTRSRLGQGDSTLLTDSARAAEKNPDLASEPVVVVSDQSHDLNSLNAKQTRTRIKNRRKAYLDRHPSYFNPELELSDPLLFDQCIRRFQTPAEREAAGRAKGYARVLEADLLRSEAKLTALTGRPIGAHGSDFPFTPTYHIAPGGDVEFQGLEVIPKTKEEGMRIWEHEMSMRFIAGHDLDFDYRITDEDDTLDILEQQDAEERWFDDEEPEWDSQPTDGSRAYETGIQDY